MITLKSGTNNQKQCIKEKSFRKLRNLDKRFKIKLSTMTYRMFCRTMELQTYDDNRL